MERANAERNFNETGDIRPLQRACERDGAVPRDVTVLSGIVAAVFGSAVIRALAIRRPGEIRFSRCDGVIEKLHSYWDGGTRDSWERLNLETGQRYGVQANVSPLSADPGARWEPTPGEALICYTEGGSRGGIRIWKVEMHPDDFFRLWWASQKNSEELSRDERIVLVATRSYKASYAGIKEYRFRQARSECGMSRERWDAAKASLIARKLLNRAGAITPAGKAAIGDVSYGASLASLIL